MIGVQRTAQSFVEEVLTGNKMFAIGAALTPRINEVGANAFNEGLLLFAFCNRQGALQYIV